jgi:hypothetical protein
VKTHPKHGGKACAHKHEGVDCNTFECPVDCALTDWTTFDECTKSCGTGYKTRTRSLKVEASHGGKICDARTNTEKCNTANCPIDCIMDLWNDWSACSQTCGGGTQTRHRGVKQAGAYGGKACKHRREYQSCKFAMCPVDCVVSGFDDWTSCTTTCGTDGRQHRTRSVVTQPRAGGRSCPEISKHRDCNTFECPVDCVVTAFGSCSTCSKSCGGGKKMCSRDITTFAAHGGIECPELSQKQTCNPETCPEDCIPDNWGGWSVCTKTCNGGVQTRKRGIKHPASAGGKHCPRSSLFEQRACHTDECAVDCKVSSWSEFGACTVKCNGGVSVRSRSIITPTQHSGAECPSLTNNKRCNSHSCVKHCIFEWKPWTACSQSCGGGAQVRKLVIKQLAAHGGRECPKEQDRLCNTHLCPTKYPTTKPTPSPTPVPKTIPLIRITGKEIITIDADLDGKYSDEGATCSDTIDGILAVRAVGVSAVQMDKLGTYIVSYHCLNKRGFPARSLKRLVVVKNTACPVCRLLGSDITIEASFPFADPGAYFEDAVDRKFAPTSIVSDVDMEKVGVYHVTYKGKNSAGRWNDDKFCHNPHTCTRQVTVVDTLKPVIALQYHKKLLHVGAANDKGVGGETNPMKKFKLMAVQDVSSSHVTMAALTALVAGVALLARSHRKATGADLQQLV